MGVPPAVMTRSQRNAALVLSPILTMAWDAGDQEGRSVAVPAHH